MAKERNARMRFTGKSTWINQETGEIREFDEFEKPIGRNQPFMITYLAEIINLIDNLGNKKMQVVKYILENMNKSNNSLIITTRELAEKSKVGFNTVIETLKILDNAGIIERRTGAIMISPKLINNKKADGEASLMIKYKNFSSTSKGMSEDENNNL